MFMNIAAPEIGLGAALLSFFVLVNFPQRLLTIFIAHVMFNIAFVAIVVRARLSGFHREETAQDPFDAWQTFPLWVYGAVKVGIPPQVFVMGPRCSWPGSRWRW